MTWFELRTSGVGSDHSTNWATPLPTGLGYLLLLQMLLHRANLKCTPSSPVFIYQRRRRRRSSDKW